MPLDGSQLPYDILVQVFECAVKEDAVHGGEIVRWASHERAHPFALVCKAWYRPAQFVLFGSVAIFNPREARLFLRTIAAKPHLAGHTRLLVVTLDEEEEEVEGESAEEMESRHILESQQLTRVLEACPSLERLQARTVHPSAAWPFLEAIIAKPRILTFVGGPRPINYHHSWHQLEFPQPVPLLFPTLRQLDLESPFAAGTRPAPILLFPVLEEARLACEIPEDTLSGFMQATTATIWSLDIYQERLLAFEEMVLGLSSTFKILRRLKFRVNPSITDLEANFKSDNVPLFDHLFCMEESFLVLESLSVAATDISAQGLRHLPPSLRHLEISSFSDFSHFTFSDQLLEVVRDASVQFRLETLVVRDVPDCWGAEGNVDKMAEACKARGIAFTFVAEDD